MSLWWAKREQLDDAQVELIEELDLNENFVVLGPPGSGKTNVLLRRAQFARNQGMPNVLVITYTRTLTEFLRTGCFNAQGQEIFPTGLITTMESWLRGLFRQHSADIPAAQDHNDRRRLLAVGALDIVKSTKMPKYDALFVDEAQDLLPEEVELLSAWATTIFCVGDDRQKIYTETDGLNAIRQLQPAPHERALRFHYRLTPEICEMADRILSAASGQSLASTCHYDGPKPGRISVHALPDRQSQMEAAAKNLEAQQRVYGDLIARGDRLGVVVPRRADREELFELFESYEALEGRSQIVRARSGDEDDRDYNPTLDPERPIIILTEQGCKGLEFRALHWLFANELTYYRTDERYYTIVTRAKTSLDIYHAGNLPQTLARSYAEKKKDIWG